MLNVIYKAAGVVGIVCTGLVIASALCLYIEPESFLSHIHQLVM